MTGRWFYLDGPEALIDDQGMTIGRIERKHGYVAAAAPELYSAALEVMKSFEAYNLVGPNAKPEDQWDEYDHAMAPAWRALKAAIEKATAPKGNNDD